MSAADALFLCSSWASCMYWLSWRVHGEVSCLYFVIYEFDPWWECRTHTLHDVLIYRSRPRATRINKRFLSRTVASAAVSRPSRGHEIVSSAGGETQHRNQHATGHRHQHQQQQKSGVSHRRQCDTASPRNADKRKHSADSDAGKSSDRQQTDTYDVHDYMVLNKEYKRAKKRQRTSSWSVRTNITSDSLLFCLSLSCSAE